MAHKILLADDSITIQKVVNLTFSDEGINVVTVGNGELALKKLGDESYDLVLADIFMPGRNGYEVCEHVKSSPQSADVPVILLVGAFEPFDKAEAARVRADGHLTKPFESRILIETVKRMLAEAAVRKAEQQAAAAPEPAPDTGGYRGQVVGWDVATTPVPPQFEEEEPEPPPYDPYASTAKLQPIARQSQPIEAEDFGGADNRTMNFGAPLPTGALFSEPPTEEPPVQTTSPMVPVAPGSFDFAGDAPPTEALGAPDAAEAEAHVRAIEGPPDSVAGFSTTSTSGPLTGIEDEAPPPEPEPERPAIGYQQLHATDSPLDLPEMHVVESHTHPPADVAEVRDPLLDTFADVAESTARVDAEPTPGLEVNAVPEGESSMTVAPTEGLVSAWDTSAQPPEPEPEPEAQPAPVDDAMWQTRAYSLNDVPFGFGDEPSVEAAEPPSEAPPEAPAEERPSSGKPTVGLADFTGLDTMRSSNETQRISAEELRAMTMPHEPAVESVQAEAVEAVPDGWEPEVEAVAAPANGSGAPVTAIPQGLVDEVVRRTAERISDDVIREIAWEIVPDLAEQLIRKRLEQG